MSRAPVSIVVMIIALMIGVVAGYFLVAPAPPITTTVTETKTATVTSTKTAMPIEFSMGVIPERIRGESIAGQRLVFLVVVAEEGQKTGEGEAMDISATVAGSAVTVNPQKVTSGEVAEVTVIPNEESVGGNVTVTIRGQRGELKQAKTITFAVLDGEDDLGPYATEVRDKFIPWLAANQPELGITSETEWTGTIVSPRWLVVSHYLFFSDDWEMHVSWHVMIAPHDWARIDLRHRFTEAKPSHACEISSLSAGDEPRPIEPPESIWR